MHQQGSENHDEQSLWELSKGGSVDARNSLIQHFSPIVRKISGHLFSNRIDDSVDYDDYYQYGMVGLIESIDRYESNKGASFETFASYRIRGAILNGLAKQTEKREQIAFQSRLRAERVASLTESTSNSLSPFEEMIELTLGVALGLVLEGTGLVELEVCSASDTSYQNFQLAEIKQLLMQFTEKLPENEQFIIERHYFQFKTFDSIAKELGVSKGRISQLHTQALKRFRQFLNPDLKVDDYY